MLVAIQLILIIMTLIILEPYLFLSLSFVNFVSEFVALRNGYKNALNYMLVHFFSTLIIAICIYKAMPFEYSAIGLVVSIITLFFKYSHEMKIKKEK
jgi:hypothetical protein